MNRPYPKAERLGMGDQVVKLSTIAFEQLAQFGLTMCGLDPKRIGPLTERQRHAAEFAHVETLLVDPIERENFVHSQPS